MTIDRPAHNGCRSYHAGHTVHYIQALRGANDRDNVPTRCKVSCVGDDGVVRLVLDDGRRAEVWTHDPERVRQLAERGLPASYQPRWSLLLFRMDGSSAVVSVTNDLADHGACRFDEPPADPVDALLTHGGFVLGRPSADRREAREPG